MDADRLREAVAHQAGAGFIEPAAGRYQMDYGGYAVTYAGGKRFGGRPGSPVQARHHDRRASGQEHDPLKMLQLAHGVTDARYAGEETMRGTPCGMVAVSAGRARFTVWIDDDYIGRIRFQERGSGARSGASLTLTRTLELWDFGVPVGTLGYSRLPSFGEPG